MSTTSGYEWIDSFEFAFGVMLCTMVAFVGLSLTAGHEATAGSIFVVMGLIYLCQLKIDDQIR
jgi:hypothetical protein